ncbi:MAG: PDZ domain-containing protein [Candidatus Omnitrophota bacterium]
MNYFFKKNWLIIAIIISFAFNVIAAYFLYQDSKIINDKHEKSIIKQEPLDYENFKNQRGNAWLGLGVVDVTPEAAARVMIDRPEGALVESVLSNSPAQKANIEVGDIILSFNGRKIRTPQQLRSDMLGSEVGSEVYMCVAKEEYRITVYIVPQERPSYLSSPMKTFPWLGVFVSDVIFGSEEADKIEKAGKAGGVLVEEVIPDSPAQKAGLLKDDIITSFNNRKTRTLREFLSDLAGVEPGEEARMCIMREDTRKTIYVILEKNPVSTEI